MSRQDTLSGLTVRPFRPEDEDAVLDLLRAALGEGPAGSRSARFFRWKHLENPFGESFMLVAEAGGRIVGLRAFLRWRLRSGGRTLEAVRAVDTATRPDVQGRGIFSRLTQEALEALRGDVDLVFNTPNDKSLPGYLKMGWRVVGRVPVRVRVRRPVRFLRGLGSLRRASGAPGDAPETRGAALDVAEALADSEGLDHLLAGRRPERRLETLHDPRSLRWRYAAAPGLGYLAVREPPEGPLRGVAIFRVHRRGRLWESTVAEVLVAPGDRRTAGRLLARAVGAVPVDHAICSFPAGTVAAAAARRHGFLRSPRGITLVVNPLRGDIAPDPEDLGSWALSLGDLEVF